MKNGFTYNGAEGEVLFGAFDRRQGSIQYGVQDGNKALYIAVNRLTETGWRQHSPSKLAQIFADLGWRGGAGEIHLRLSGADTDLTRNSTTPPPPRVALWPSPPFSPFRTIRKTPTGSPISMARCARPTRCHSKAIST